MLARNYCTFSFVIAAITLTSLSLLSNAYMKKLPIIVSYNFLFHNCSYTFYIIDLCKSLQLAEHQICGIA